MFCNHCGQEMKIGVKFCPYCGETLLSMENAALAVSDGEETAVVSDMPEKTMTSDAATAAELPDLEAASSDALPEASASDSPDENAILLEASGMIVGTHAA